MKFLKNFYEILSRFIGISLNIIARLIPGWVMMIGVLFKNKTDEPYAIIIIFAAFALAGFDYWFERQRTRYLRERDFTEGYNAGTKQMLVALGIKEKNESGKENEQV